MSRRPFEPTGTSIEFTPDGGIMWRLNYVDVTPPALDGGEPVDTVVLSTNRWRTKISPNLIDLGNISFTAEYQPEAVMTAPLNDEGVIRIIIPGEGVLTVRGYLRAITPDSMRVGERATCSGEFVITNTGADGFTEIPPSWTDAEGVVPTYFLGGLTLAMLRAICTALTISHAGKTAEELVLLVQQELDNRT